MPNDSDKPKITKLEAGDPDTQSLDPIADNIAKLKALFPELVTESKDGHAVNVDVLKQLVGDATVTDADEKFGLTWHGKRRARQLALTPSTGTLRPCPEESVDWDATQNLFIEGDNLEVLKLLQKSYAGQVKLIYIDPPYNTGNDFVYADDFRDNIANYKRLTGQVDEDGIPLTTNREASGRFHTDWLSMMYPRLKMAKDLLTQDGILWVSIDDREVQNLKHALVELFGEENFLAQVVWQRAYSPVNLKKTFSENHDFILGFSKNIEAIESFGLRRTDEANARYSNPDNDPRGDWKSSDLSVGPAVAANIYEITVPSGRVVSPPAGYSWRLSRERFEEFVRDNRIWFGESGNAVPSIKRFLSEVKDSVTPMTIWPREDVGDSQEATRELKALFDDKALFSYPKPVRLMQRLIELSTRDTDIVMDFFAGSGTTGHAVMAQNALDGGTRRCILVQLPEQLDPATKNQKAGADYCDSIGKPRTLAELTKERLRRAAAKVKDEAPMFTGDTGFRVFKLDSSNINAWEPDRDDIAGSLVEHVEHLKVDRSEQDILYELLLKRGLDLCVPIETKDIAGKPVQSIGAGSLFACLAESIDAEAGEALALGIVDWHKELDPAGDTAIVFRDDAFADDVVKTNVAAILDQNGLKNVRSL